MIVDRRRVLAAAAGLAAAAPAGALAFSVQEPSAAARELYLNACTRRSFHDELIAEVRAILADKGQPVSEAEVRDALRALSCPLCGCPLTAALSE